MDEQRNREPDLTEQVDDYMQALPMYPAKPTRNIVDAVEYVRQEGPSARRPVWAPIVLLPDYPEEHDLFGNRLHEVIVPGTDIRILATFSPDRVLVLLFVGDKEGEWKRWYRRAIPEAARLYRAYLEVFNLE